MRIHLIEVKCQNTNLRTGKALLYLLLMLILKLKDSYHSIGSRAANSVIVSNAAPAHTNSVIVSNAALAHRMDNKRKSFLFPRQYRDCFSQRINALAFRN